MNIFRPCLNKTHSTSSSSFSETLPFEKAFLFTACSEMQILIQVKSQNVQSIRECRCLFHGLQQNVTYYKGT